MALDDKIEQQLLCSAQEGIRHAFTKSGDPASSRIGAAVLTAAGNIFGSGHYTSLTNSLTLHAEQAALSHAAAHGEYAIKKVLVTWNEAAEKIYGAPVYPCHMCKQLLWEHALRTGQATEVLVVSPDGRLADRFALEDVMSRSWPQKCEKNH